MNINQSKQQDSTKIKSGCLISKIPTGYNESLLISSNIYVPESVSNIYQVSIDLDGLIKNAAKEKNIDHEFIINDDKITAYFVDEKDLYVKCNLFDYCNIEWFIEKNKSFDSCEEALSRIHLIKNKLNELEKIIFNLSLEQKDNNDE